MEGSVVKFFLSNLLDGCTPWELSCFLKPFGVVAGTYVAKKRDKKGNRFGFASFKEVKDLERLSENLKGLKMGGNNLFVNIARFAVKNSGFSGKHGPNGKAQEGNNVMRVQVDKDTWFSIRDGRSYSEVLGKDSMAGSVHQFGSPTEKSAMVSDRTSGFEGLFGKAVVGRTVDLETLVDFDRLMRIAGTRFSKIHYLGGLSLMISFEEAADASSFLEANSIWGPWFSKLVLWEGQSLSSESVAWLKIIGMPLHLICPEVLKSIGVLFGKVLDVSAQLEEDQDLSVFRVGILAGEFKRIQEYVNLKGKDRQFRVWMEEELVDWVPDCLDRESELSMDSESPLKSSPVAMQSVVGAGEDVGLSKGNPILEEVRGGGSVSFSAGELRRSDDEPSVVRLSKPAGESSSKVAGKGNVGIFYFKSGGKSNVAESLLGGPTCL
ncbi:putative RNA recognition motif domain, nucleotide-binding alpha-beta plait domain superfamily [Helianthus annuus]|nr:putative RNA recognition motif domain, nucleotide-binding alpha-beta plait domain superfamily [Helianthus annuus]